MASNGYKPTIINNQDTETLFNQKHFGAFQNKK